MSLEVRAKLICDTCGMEIHSSVEHRSTRAMRVVWDVKKKGLNLGWKEINRGRFHTPTHYCPACADKPMKPVPRRNNAEA